MRSHQSGLEDQRGLFASLGAGVSWAFLGLGGGHLSEGEEASLPLNQALKLLPKWPCWRRENWQLKQNNKKVPEGKIGLDSVDEVIANLPNVCSEELGPGVIPSLSMSIFVRGTGWLIGFWLLTCMEESISKGTIFSTVTVDGRETFG